MDTDLTSDASKKLFEQYEQIRAEGLFNMLMRLDVQEYAADLGFDELAELSRAEYSQLLANYGKLKELHGSS